MDSKSLLDGVAVDLGHEILDDDSESSHLTLPYNFAPRDYQWPFWDAVITRNVRRSVCVWHRRAGKDKTHFNALIVKAMQRVGNYGYIFPTYSQGRHVLWEAIDADGFRVLDHALPVQTKRNNTSMTLTLINGGTISVLGVDEDLDSKRGMNLVGCVFSEFSYQDPNGWERVFRPMLLENRGFAWFNWTPQGRNHAYQLDKVAKDSEDWFYSKLTILDTKRHDGTPVVSVEDVEQERGEGVEEEIIQQEYYVSYDASVRGAYYAVQIRDAWAQGRMCRVPVDPLLDVHTFWDIGIGDANAIWFVQMSGPEIRVVDYYENTGEGLPHYLNYLKEWQDRYKTHYGQHWAPHDIVARDYSTGTTRQTAAQEAGFSLRAAPKLGVDEGIDMCRRLFPRCWFDAERCDTGLSALTEYRKQWDDKRQAYLNAPVHSWASHGADAFRTLGVIWHQQFGEPVEQTSFPVKMSQDIWNF